MKHLNRMYKTALALSLAMLPSVALADAYKTSNGTVVVTGLQPTQRYQIRILTTQNKSTSLQDKSANRCGEVVVDKAANYITTLVVGTETLDLASLPLKEHVKCPRLPSASKWTPSGVVLATPPAPR